LYFSNDTLEKILTL